jgi:GNAT superfamily N-acetyltransferase
MQKSETEVEVTRTYLQMTSRDQLRAFRVVDAGVRIDRLQQCPASFFRFLYAEVGRPYHWVDRLGWTDEEIREYLSNQGVSLWVMYVEGSPAGYFELSKGEDGSTEIAYFGLLQEFLGRGLGKHLLSEAIERAWEMGAARIWLHTCTLDDPAAMPNYLKRGLEPFKQETYLTTISPKEEPKLTRPGAQ